MRSELAAENRTSNSTFQRHAAGQPDRTVQLQSQLVSTKSENGSTEQQIGAAEELSSATISARSPWPRRPSSEYRELTRDYHECAGRSIRSCARNQMEAQVAQNLESDRKGERFTLIEPRLRQKSPSAQIACWCWIIGVLLSLGLAGGTVALARDARHHRSAVGASLLALLSEAPLALIPTIGTDLEVRNARHRLRYALGAVAILAVSAILAVHFVYRPVDVLWFSVLRKLGL